MKPLGQAMVWTVARLEADGYSVPRGAHGIPEPTEHMERHYVVHWLPPHSGASVPVPEADLSTDDVPPLSISSELMSPELRGRMERSVDAPPLRVELRGMVVCGKDGLHHTEDCCRISEPWSREDKGLASPEFVSTPWRFHHAPHVGEDVGLPDKGGEQTVGVKEVVHGLAGVVVYVGGWTHWESQDVHGLFALARAHAERNGW